MLLPTWHILSNPTLPSTPPVTISYVALHPTRGIALLDLASASTPNAVPCVRAALGRIGFDNAHPGHLPIIHRQIDGFDRMTLVPYLEAAFLAEPPITLGSSRKSLKWPAMALRVFGVPDVAMLPAFMPDVALPEGPQLDVRASPSLSQPAPLHRKAVVASVATVGGVLLIALCVAGLTAPVTTSLPPSQAQPAPAPSVPEPATPAAALPIPSPVETLAPSTSEPAPLAKPSPLTKPLAPHVSAAAAIAQAQKYMALHNVVSARTWYEYAYAAGDGTAAASLGQTYDAAGDHANALAWYDKARAIGGADVDFALRMLVGTQR